MCVWAGGIRCPCCCPPLLVTAINCCLPTHFAAWLQPPLEEAESVRDVIIGKLFEELGRQGLDAHHPFSAYGGGDGGDRVSAAAACSASA